MKAPGVGVVNVRYFLVDIEIVDDPNKQNGYVVRGKALPFIENPIQSPARFWGFAIKGDGIIPQGSLDDLRNMIALSASIATGSQLSVELVDAPDWDAKQ